MRLFSASPKMLNNWAQKRCLKIETFWVEKWGFWGFPITGHQNAAKVLAKSWKLLRMFINMGKSEKIIKIGPETAEIEQKSPKIGKIAKISKLGSDFGALFRPIFGVSQQKVAGG